MIVTRGLGQPSAGLVTNGLGRFAFLRALYARIGGAWRLVTAMFIHDGGSWVEIDETHVRLNSDWQQIWGWAP